MTVTPPRQSSSISSNVNRNVTGSLSREFCFDDGFLDEYVDDLICFIHDGGLLLVSPVTLVLRYEFGKCENTGGEFRSIAYSS